MTKIDTAEREALRALRRGFSVIALKPHSKVPAEKGWREKAFKTVWSLKAYIASHTAANFGILTGSDSGFVVLDPDGRKGRRALQSVVSIPTVARIGMPKEKRWARLISHDCRSGR